MMNLKVLNAVINNDAAMLQKLKAAIASESSSCALGFTALELANFLGSDACVEVLKGKRCGFIIVQKKGEPVAHKISIDAFEKFFNISYRSTLHLPSYSFLKNLIKCCPYTLRVKWLAFQNYAWTNKYRDAFLNSHLANISIRWISDEKGYGAFAESDIKAEEFIGEYTGRVRSLVRFVFFKKNYTKLLASSPNAYCLHYPTKFWSLNYTVIDALHEGNLTRFINHGKNPNLKPLCLIDRGLLRTVFVAAVDIPKGAELLFDYGPDFANYITC